MLVAENRFHSCTFTIYYSLGISLPSTSLIWNLVHFGGVVENSVQLISSRVDLAKRGQNGSGILDTIPDGWHTVKKLECRSPASGEVEYTWVVLAGEG